MPAAGFVALEGVAAHQLRQLEEVGHPARLLQRLVDRGVFAEYAYVAPVLLAQGGDLLERGLEAIGGARHPAVLPHHLSELAVERVHRALPVDGQQLRHPGGHRRLRFAEGRMIRPHLGQVGGGQVIADRVRDHEVPVGQPLHERAGPQPVGPVVGEVRFAQHVQAGDRAHEVVVDPQAAHRVVDGGVDAHGNLVRVLVGDALVHVEEVAVLFPDHGGPEALDGVRKVQVDAVPAGTHAAPFVRDLLGRARGDVARHQVAERGIAPLEVVVAVRFRDLVRQPGVALLLRHPDAAVVAQRLAHERELALVIAADRDAGGVDLREAGVREVRALLVGAPDGGRVRALGVGREVEDVAVASAGQDHGVRDVRLHLARDQVAGHDAARAAIDHDDLQHLVARVHGDLAQADLLLQRLVGAEQELLAGLAARVERARDLGASEGPVGQRAAVLARERDALGRALVDDVEADLGQAIDVGLAGAEVPALHGVVEEPEDAVAVVLVVLGRVDPALGGDGVGAARAVLVAEALHVVAELGHGRGRGGAGEAGADHDHVVLALVGRVHQLHLEAVLVPLLLDRPVRHLRRERHQRTTPGCAAVRVSALPCSRTRPVSTATGKEMLPARIKNVMNPANA